MIFSKKIKSLLPKTIIKEYRNYINRYLLEEIKKLPIHSMGIDKESDPWVKLKKGLTFYGVPPTPSQIFIHEILNSKLNIKLECICVIIEIIVRYLAPRSIPGCLTFSNTKYWKGRDPLSDFSLQKEELKKLTNIFQPKKGEVFMDIGAFHGFGTLRVAESITNSGKIIAVEVDKKNQKLIKKNFESNGFNNIYLVNAAASNFNSEKSFYFNDKIPSGNSLRGDVLENLGVSKMEELPTKVVTGDKIMCDIDINKIDLLSLTINGSEPEALEGLSKTIKNSNNIRITTPGWYFRDGERLDKLVQKALIDLGLKNIKIGKEGRVIAWK